MDMDMVYHSVSPIERSGEELGEQLDDGGRAVDDARVRAVAGWGWG